MFLKLIFITVLILSIVYEYIYCRRGIKVFKLRRKVFSLCYKNKVSDIFVKGPGFNMMLLSFKPVTAESFYTQEELELMKYYD